MLPLSEVQAQIYQALVPALAPVPVLDMAGPDQDYPFCTLGEFTAEQFDTVADQGVDMDVTVHIWSRQQGMQECQQLMQRAKDALHGRSLPATGFGWVATVWQFGQTLRDADGLTRHGVLRFRVSTFSRS